VPIITKELAEAIAKKLGAVIDSRPGRPHDLARIYHAGRVVALFGIRRGSGKNLGHDHIPSQIYVSTRQARLLGQCPMSREEWIEVMQEKGKL
jgi:hypothetical protein